MQAGAVGSRDSGSTEARCEMQVTGRRPGSSGAGPEHIHRESRSKQRSGRETEDTGCKRDVAVFVSWSIKLARRHARG